ncbi:MAG: GDP-L-fucose synthase [bacterium]
MQIKNKKILLTGASGFLGTYVLRELKKQKPKIIYTPSHLEADLTNRKVCEKVVNDIDIVIHLAALIGGIGFIDKRPGDLFYQNVTMGIELMEASRKAGVKKFVTMGTVCEYPEYTKIPFNEDDLWMGYPEETTAPYGWAKKILIVQSKAYRKQYGFNSIHLLPVNLYGPGDNFDKKLSHVIPALIKRFVEAKRNNEKKVKVWGSGLATREFLYITDAAKAIVLATQKYDLSEPINLGTGVETSIKEVSEMIANIVDFRGKIVWDRDKPDGQPRRRLDISRAKKIGYSPSVMLREGLERTIEWYEKNF